MQLLHRESLSLTVDRVNACFFTGDRPGRKESNEVIDWILTRFAAPTAYGKTFGITARDERSRLHTFTGEPLTSRASLRHIHAEETCRVLILLNRVVRRKTLPQLAAASAALEERIEHWEAQGKPAGMFCCGPCTVGLWRHLAVGGLGDRANGLDDGIRELRRHRDGKSGWGRFPFFYTLSALVEIDGPNARTEIVYARSECERRLKSLRANTTFGARRRTLLERILALS